MQRTIHTMILAAALGLTGTAALEAAPFGEAGRAGTLGLGLRAGAPTGLSLKYWMNRHDALDVAVGTFGHYRGQWYSSGINVHADYLRHYYGVFGTPAAASHRQLPVYLGVGALYSSPDVIGVRGVVGLTWLFEEAPFDLFFDLAPTLVITPGTGFGIGAGLGGRFYF